MSLVVGTGIWSDLSPLHMAAISIPILAYQILMHWKYGATLGKMAAGIRVVHVEGEGPLTLKQCLVRDIVPVVMVIIPLAALAISDSLAASLQSATRSTNGLWGLAEIVTALFNAKRRAVHDFLADTVCIRI